MSLKDLTCFILDGPNFTLFRGIGYNNKYMRNLSDLADSLLHRGLSEIDILYK